MAETVPGIINANIDSRGDYAVNFNSTDMGLVDDVDPSGVKPIWDDITTGSTGKKNVIGKRLVGDSGTVKVQFRQLSFAQYQKLAPWSTGTPLQLIPPLNTDLYNFAQPLVLHPDDLGTSTTEDVTFIKACPMTLPLYKRTGGGPNILEVEFAVFGDRNAFNASDGTMAVGNIKGT